MPFADRHRRVGRVLQQLPPVRAELPDRDREHDQREAREPEDVLHRGELHPPQDQPDRERCERDEQQVVDPGDQLEGQGDAADLGDERQQRDRDRGQQVHQPGARSEPLPDQVERAPPADGSDPPGHLGEHADPDDADDDDPGQGHPEPGADDRIRDQVADVDEPTDRREDPEHDSEEPLHPYRSSAASVLRGPVQVDESLGHRRLVSRRFAILAVATASEASPSSFSISARTWSEVLSGG